MISPSASTSGLSAGSSDSSLPGRLLAAYQAMRHSYAFVPLCVLLANLLIWAAFTADYGFNIAQSQYPTAECTSSSFPSTYTARELLASQVTSPVVISDVREKLRNKWVHMIGDSTLRETYFEYTSMLQRNPPGTPVTDAITKKRYSTRHESQLTRIGSSRVTFDWRPYLSDVVSEIEKLRHATKKPDMLVMSVGLWDLLYSNQTHLDSSIQALGDAIATSSTPLAHYNNVLFKSSPAILDSELTDHRLNTPQFRNGEIIVLNEKIRKDIVDNDQYHLMQWADGHTLSAGRGAEFNDDGVHSKAATITGAIALVAYTQCSVGLPLFALTAGQILVMTLFITVTMLLAYLTTANMFRKVVAGTNTKQVYAAVPTAEDKEDGSSNGKLPTENGNGSIKSHASDLELNSLGTRAELSNGTTHANDSNGLVHNPLHSLLSVAEAQPSTSKPPTPYYSPNAPLSINNFFAQLQQSTDMQDTIWAIFQLILVLIIVYILDSDYRLSWRLVGDKAYSRDLFIFLIMCILMYAWTSMKPILDRSGQPSSKMFQVQQTSEWKGWMQIAFVLYHYWKAEETYNFQRIFIAAYIWQTGYGYYQKFSKQNPDFGFISFMKSMFRLNFFVLCICLVLNREYMQYYVCPLHTFFTIFTYVLMYVGHQSGWNHGWKLGCKFVVGFTVIALIWEFPQTGLFNLLFNYKIFYWKGSLYEWLFRSTLDHYATMLGIVSGWAFPHIERQLVKMEHNKMLQTAVATALLGIGYLWLQHYAFMVKFSYNAQHPYIFMVPIYCYLLLRNLTANLRSKYLSIFAWVGGITLETYILQFHIWLSDDAATIIKYLPNYPLLNFTISSIIYLILSKITSDLTGVLSNSLISKNITTQQLVERLIIVGALGWTVWNVAAIGIITSSASSSTI